MTDNVEKFKKIIIEMNEQLEEVEQMLECIGGHILDLNNLSNKFENGDF